ncbi:MAG: ribbon-helix-helix domain-containing protein [Erythrobacter sp.]
MYLLTVEMNTPAETPPNHVPYHPPVKRSIAIAGHKTSISLEPVFWDMLRAAAKAEGVPVSAFVARIDAERIKAQTPPGLASAIRVWLVSAL